MKRILVTIFFFCCINNVSLFAQQLELQTTSYFGIWNNEVPRYFYGGGGLSMIYEHTTKFGGIRGGVELRSIDWGNQVNFNLGHKMDLYTKERWSINGIGSVGLGIALFRNNPIFGWSVAYLPEIILRSHKRVNFTIGTGLRYTISPGYQDYGPINQVLEWPFRLGIRYQLGKNN